MKTSTTPQRMQHQIQVHSFSQRNCFLIKDARVHYVVLKQQPHHTPTPPTRHTQKHAPHSEKKGHVRETRKSTPPPKGGRCCSRTQQCAKRIITITTNNPYDSFPAPQRVLYLNQEASSRSKDYFIDIPPLSNPPRNFRSRSRSLLLTPPTQPMRAISWRLVLLRKEVIQPHLPVRLPCYDLVPIASPTFDSSLPTRGLGHRLRVLPTFVT